MTATGLAMGFATLVLTLSPPAFARRGTVPGDGLISDSIVRTFRVGSPPLDSIRGEIFKNKGLIEAQTQDEILKHANFRELRGFYIDYATLQCVSTPRAGDAVHKALGACVAKAHAFQLTADVAVNVSSTGITVQALATVVE